MYRDTLLVVHLASVAAWLGANFVQLFLAPWFAKRPVAEHAAWVDASRLLGQRYYNVAGAVIGVSGVLLVVETSYNFSAGFVAVGIAVIVIGALLGIFAFTRLAERQAEALRNGDPATAGALGNRIAALAVLDTALVVTAVVTMVAKWQA
jgi:hypothetical protein